MEKFGRCQLTKWSNLMWTMEDQRDIMLGNTWYHIGKYMISCWEIHDIYKTTNLGGYALDGSK